MKNRSRLLVWCLLAAATAALGVPLMYRAQTVISTPEPGKQEPLYGLSYKAKAFEAKVSAVTLTLSSAPDADPVVGEWTFLASNSDGQMHKVEIFTRLLDEAGTQIDVTSKACMLGGGYQDFQCHVPLKLSAEKWKTVKSIRIVTDWQS